MVTHSGIGRRSLDRLSWHETAHHHQAPPCKQRPPWPVGVNIFLSEGQALLLSSPNGFRQTVTLSVREEPNATPLELDALLLFELPLLFTFMKLVEEDETGERSHQFAAAIELNGTRIVQCLTCADYGRSLYLARSFFMTALTRRISVSTISLQNLRVSISIPKSSCASSS